MQCWRFVIPGPLRGHVCSVASRRGLSKWQAYVRLLANSAGVPAECPAGVHVDVAVMWRRKARIDVENVGKVIVDSLWARDRGVRSLTYQSTEHGPSEGAAVQIRI